MSNVTGLVLTGQSLSPDLWHSCSVSCRQNLAQYELLLLALNFGALALFRVSVCQTRQPLPAVVSRRTSDWRPLLPAPRGRGPRSRGRASATSAAVRVLRR